MATIFTKIISGEVPCYKVFEDDLTIAFLDIVPICLGHTLVVPTVEVDYFVDVKDPHYSAVFQTAKRISPAIQKATGVRRIATAVVGLEVPHFHYHLIPINQISDFSFAKKISPRAEELQAMLERIRKNLV